MTQPLPVTGADLIPVPRDLLAAACYAVRYARGDDTWLFRQLSALSLSTPSTGAAPEGMREALATIIDPYIDDDGSHGSYMAQQIARKKADDIIAHFTPAPVPATREGWEAGRDAALAECFDMARAMPTMVHPMFLPAIDGIRHTLTTPSDTGDAWRTDMEAAPRDGTPILGCMVNEARVYQAVIWWDDEFESGEWDETADSVSYTGAWTAGRVGSFSYEEYASEKPTAWCALPPAPKAESSERLK